MAFDSKKYLEIRDFLRQYSLNNNRSMTKIIAVTKYSQIEDINEALNFGIRDFGEIRVQDAFNKYMNLKNIFEDLKLHMIGTMQKNKVKKAIKIFDYFHSLDSTGLAIEFSKYPEEISSKKFFVQVNTGYEEQKSGILPKNASEFIKYCVFDLHINVVGLMCIPPINEEARKHFIVLNNMALKNNLKQLSIGMSRDYKCAVECGATLIRIGSDFFRNV